jgi:hypothetical protein
VAGGPGFEPRLTESESAVLPLNYPPPAPPKKSLKRKTFARGSVVYHIVSEIRIILSGLIEFVGQIGDDGLWVDVVEGGQDALFKHLFGSDQDRTRRGARELGEESINQVEPGAVLRDEEAGRRRR